MPDKSATRMARQRAARKKLGLVRREYWAPAEHHKQIAAMLERLAARDKQRETTL